MDEITPVSEGSNVKELDNEKLDDNILLLGEAIVSLVPWLKPDNRDLLKTQTEETPESYLDSFYLFPLDEISVNSDCTDISNFVNKRFQNILAAASHSGLSVALVLSSQAGKHRVFIGFRSESDRSNDPELFESILNGLLPGKHIGFKETASISSLAKGLNYGGVITGVPIVEDKGEKHKFNLSSVARSLYGKDYVLAVISKPVSDEEKIRSFYELNQLRDVLHRLARQTIGKETGVEESVSGTETKTTGISKTKGVNVGITGMAGTFFSGALSVGLAPLGMLGMTVASGVFSGIARSISGSSSLTKSESISRSETKSTSKSQSFSISVEKQNSIALELEKIADQYIERMIRGFRGGYWETTITFATKDRVSSEILAGTFVGELSKPSNKMLPPPKIYLDSLDDRTLFVPKVSSENPLFPKILASYVTSEELALISSPPTEPIPGYEIQKTPVLSLTDNGSETEMTLGYIADHGNPIEGVKIHLSKGDLNKHIFVGGLTGSGKTTTVKHILKELAVKEGIPFLVLESVKHDYRQLLSNEIFRDNLYIFTIGDATVSPIRFNPFYIQEGVHPLKHIDYLKALFNASFSLYGPMPGIIEKALHTIYEKKGWDLTSGTHPYFMDRHGNYDSEKYKTEEHYYCFPTLNDLKEEVAHYIKTELDYQGELRDNIRTAILVRLESLSVGAKGLMFNTHDFFPMSELLSRNTILEMENLADDDDKAFFVGLILILIREYRERENPAINPGMGQKGLRHLLVIEEAHRLLKNVETERITEMMGNPKGKAVDEFCNILAEMRSVGQGMIVVEQIPSKIAPDVIKNSNTKIVHRLVAKDDQILLSGSLGIDENDALYLNRLKTGHALYYREGMGKPVECVVINDVESYAVSDEKVKRVMSSLSYDTLHSYKTYQIDTWLGKSGQEVCIKFFNSLITTEPKKLVELRDKANEELNNLLLSKNGQYEIDIPEFSDYCSLKIMNLLTKGIYARHRALPVGIKKLLLNTINEPTGKHRNELIKSLNIYWEPYDPVQYIKEVIANLTTRYIYTHKLQFSREEVNKTVSTFLLLEDSKIIDEITKLVMPDKGEATQ